MAKFHINDNGDAGECSAKPGNCPFGDESTHFTSAEAARANYERQQTPNPAMVKVLRGEYYYVANQEDVAIMFLENGFITTSLDLVYIDSAFSDAYTRGYNNGVNVEMGNGVSSPFDSASAARRLLQALSFESDFIAYPEIVTALEDGLERQWNAGGRAGSWDS